MTPEMFLEYCVRCVQMTNHNENGECLKCGYYLVESGGGEQ